MIRISKISRGGMMYVSSLNGVNTWQGGKVVAYRLKSVYWCRSPSRALHMTKAQSDLVRGLNLQGTFYYEEMGEDRDPGVWDKQYDGEE